MAVVTFKEVKVGKFFIAFDEPYVRTTDGDGWDHVDNAFNFVMGAPVCFDPNWDVDRVTYKTIVTRYFPDIIQKCSR